MDAKCATKQHQPLFLESNYSLFGQVRQGQETDISDNILRDFDIRRYRSLWLQNWVAERIGRHGGYCFILSKNPVQCKNEREGLSFSA